MRSGAKSEFSIFECAALFQDFSKGRISHGHWRNDRQPLVCPMPPPNFSDVTHAFFPSGCSGSPTGPRSHSTSFHGPTCSKAGMTAARSIQREFSMPPPVSLLIVSPPAWSPCSSHVPSASTSSDHNAPSRRIPPPSGSGWTASETCSSPCATPLGRSSPLLPKTPSRCC